MTRLTAILICLAFVACTSPRRVDGSMRTLSIGEINEQYDSLVGTRVRASGFLLFSSSTPTVMPGLPRTGPPVRLDGNRRSEYWCAFDTQPRPLTLEGLSSGTIASIDPMVRRSGDQVGQRVLLEGMLGPRNPGTGEVDIVVGLGTQGNYAIGALRRVRLVSIDQVFCSGSRYSD